MSILAIDLGDKKCGLAIEVNGMSIPKKIVARTKIIVVINQFREEYDITGIVVGLPYDLYNKNLKQLDKTKKFIEKLMQYYPHIEISGFDERFTSFGADQILDEFGNKYRDTQMDDISAHLILESYLLKNKKKKL